MTFEEALKEKKSKKETTFFHKGVEYVWMVVPETKKYLEEYAKDNILSTTEVFFDDTAKRYAKDNKFKVYAVKMSR